VQLCSSSNEAFVELRPILDGVSPKPVTAATNVTVEVGGKGGRVDDDRAGGDDNEADWPGGNDIEADWVGGNDIEADWVGGNDIEADWAGGNDIDADRADTDGNLADRSGETLA